VADKSRCIMLFDSVHDVMRTEKLLKDRGMWCDLVPTPRQLSSECGMSVEVHCRDAKSAREFVSADSSLTGVYRIDGEQAEVILS